MNADQAVEAHELLSRLEQLGLSYAEVERLRRIVTQTQSILDAMSGVDPRVGPVLGQAWSEQSRPLIVCDTSIPDGEGHIVVTLFDPFSVPAEGDRVTVRDEQTGEQFAGVVARCDVDHGDDGITRFDLRIARA